MSQENSNIEPVIGRRARRGTAIMLSASLVISSLSGCAGTRESRIGPDDGSDACRAYVVALDSTGDYFAADMIQGAAMGALGGALIGGLATGSWKGALIGAAAGGIAGAIGGYWKSKMDQGRDQAVLAVSSDLDKEGAQIDKTHAAFRQLTDCRQNVARKIQAQYKAGQITREAASAQLRLLAGQAKRDLEIANRITGEMDKRGGEYQYAVAQIDPNVPPPSAQPVEDDSTDVTKSTPKTTRPTPHRTQQSTQTKRVQTASGPKSDVASRYDSVQTKKIQTKQDVAQYAATTSSWESGDPDKAAA